MTAHKHSLIFEVVNGVEGPSLNIGDGTTGFRLSGPKAWGGGTVIHSFKVDINELLEQVKFYAIP